MTETLGRMGGPYAAGPGGQCVCPSCGNKDDHQAGIPCTEQECSKCGSKMEREVDAAQAKAKAWFQGWAVSG